MTANPPRNYGEIAQLPERMAYWKERLSSDRGLPWAGLGLIKDLDAIMRLLTLGEFAEWLRTHPDNELQRWADEVRDAAEDRDTLIAATVDNLPTEPGRSIEQDITAAGETIADVRRVLVDAGALAADDTQTPVADLIRALLS